MAPGSYSLHPYAKLGQEIFRTSIEPVPTLPTRDWTEPADASAHVLDLNVPANLHVGYIAGDNDVVPEALRQIGIQVDMLDELAVAFNDLSHYDAIIVGIRAYELRADLPRMNWRLLDYAKNGGLLVVEYQRDFAWNNLLPAPFPAKMADQGVRVTDPELPCAFAPESLAEFAQQNHAGGFRGVDPGARRLFLEHVFRTLSSHSRFERWQ